MSVTDEPVMRQCCVGLLPGPNNMEAGERMKCVPCGREWVVVPCLNEGAEWKCEDPSLPLDSEGNVGTIRWGG